MNGPSVVLLVGLVTVSATAHAGDQRGASEPAVVLMATFRREEGVVFKECPDEKCVVSAFRTCSPVHWSSKVSTVEGTPVIFDSFVVKRPEGCRLVKFSDYTKDSWGGCTVTKRVCPSLKASQSDDSERLGCSQNEVLFTAKLCSNPVSEP